MGAPGCSWPWGCPLAIMDDKFTCWDDCCCCECCWSGMPGCCGMPVDCCGIPDDWLTMRKKHETTWLALLEVTNTCTHTHTHTLLRSLSWHRVHSTHHLIYNSMTTTTTKKPIITKLPLEWRTIRLTTHISNWEPWRTVTTYSLQFNQG